MTFIIITLLAISGLIATDIFVPSLPSIGAAFHQPLNHTELTISLFLVGYAVSQLFYGPISDRIGRKPPLVFGVLLFMLGSVICIFATSFPLFCIGRIVQGIAVGSGLSIARVVLRDTTTGVNLAVRSAQMSIFVSLSPAIAPCIGGILQSLFGFRSVFVFLFLYGVLLLFLLHFYFKETIKQKDTELSVVAVIKKYGILVRNLCFIRYVIISGIAFSCIILYANIVPFIIQQQMHLSARVNGEILLVGALGVSLGGFISSRTVRRLSPKKLLAIGLCLLTLSGILFSITAHLLPLSLIILTPLIFLTSLSCGFMFPNSVSMAFSEIHMNIGVAGALFGSVQASAPMLINFLLNTISNQGPALLGTFYTILGIMGFGLLKLRIKHKK
jgi:DHA1 family 2-module integral membrane pump EmrD-like MFS transporter